MRQQAEYAFRMNGLLAKAGKLRSDWFSQRFLSTHPTTVGANRGLIRGSEGLSTYIEIFNPKKSGFSFRKNTSQIFF